MATSRVLLALVLAGCAGSAMAHGGHAGAHFGAGLAHPFSGLDHVLAMLAVGMVATQCPGHGRWLLPAGFVMAMLAGAGLGALGVALPGVEVGIAVSVVVLGAWLALGRSASLWVMLPLVGVFALFHGAAHFDEAGNASLVRYAAGFAVATATLHGVGYLLARWAPRSLLATRAKRAAGMTMAGVGLVLLGG
ncbi:HupE/UreJ family protein [Denitromonas sp.]|uniref:HupE/UreJ family protein n=1 Tax=Denitromonas sp. TaxID=2734609 RepID=UPI003A882B00